MGRNGPGARPLDPTTILQGPNAPAHFEGSPSPSNSRAAAGEGTPHIARTRERGGEGKAGGGDVEPVLAVVRGPAVPQVGEDGGVGHGGAVPAAPLLRAARRHLRRRLLHRRGRCRCHRAALQGEPASSPWILLLGSCSSSTGHLRCGARQVLVGMLARETAPGRRDFHLARVAW